MNTTLIFAERKAELANATGAAVVATAASSIQMGLGLSTVTIEGRKPHPVSMDAVSLFLPEPLHQANQPDAEQDDHGC